MIFSPPLPKGKIFGRKAVIEIGWMSKVFLHLEEQVANKVADGIIRETCPDSARCEKCRKVFPTAKLLGEHEKTCKEVLK